ncbi:AAA family ATPase [Anaerobacillus sp. MEB173]|uniref:AAA family ATPase n=1 Tax=Anaerobacillus sp. MEB173 TaxID=3383345 RepID=UPI003F92E468
MRFDYLTLRAFGHFTDYELKFDETKNFHLLYGRNEAGKSTILRSIPNFLYGFPRSTPDSFLHSNQKLRIEGKLKNKNGESFQFIRRKGQKNTVLDIDSNPIDEKKVYEYLNGISENQFINMFALNHVRIREGGESLFQSDGNVGQSLFSAASGFNVLRNVLDELENKSRDLYVKGGSTRTINQAIKEEKEITKKMSDMQLKIQEWKDLERKYHDDKKEIERLSDEIKALSREEMKLERLKQTLPKIALRKELLEKREDLKGVPDLPLNIEEIRKENDQKLASAQKAKKKAEENLQDIKNQLEEISIPDGLINQATMIESLYREVDSYQKDVKKLPIIEGEYRQLEQRIKAVLKEIDATKVELTNIERYRLSIEKKKTIRELSEQKPLLDQKYKAASEDVEEVESTLNNVIKELEEIGEVPDVDELEIVLDKVKREGKLELILKEKKVKQIQLKKDIEDSIQALPLWSGTSDELLQLKVPNLKETVKKYQTQLQHFSYELQQVQEKTETEQTAIEANEKRIRELESLADIPTEEILQQSRNHRDAGWLVIRNKLNTGEFEDAKLQAFTNGLPVDHAFEKSVYETDDIADKMRREAEKLGEKNKFIADIETSENKVIALTKEQGQIEEKIKQWDEEWKNHWKVITREPLSPEEMLEWLEKYESILTIIREKQAIETEQRELEDTLKEVTGALEKALATESSIAKGLSLEDLVAQAEKTRKHLTEQKNEQNNLLKLKKELEGKLTHIKGKKEELSGQLKQWKEKWENALDGLTVSKESSPTIIKELLEMYDSCVCDYDDMKQMEEEIASMKERIVGFEERVKGLKLFTVSTVVDHGMDLAVNELYGTLQKAREDQATMTNLQQLVKREEGYKKEAEFEIEEAKDSLNQLMVLANCHAMEDFDKIISLFKQKIENGSRIEQIESQLIELVNGRTIHELIEEAHNVEKDSIDIELVELTKKRNELDTIRSQTEQAFGVIKKEYTEKIEGANFASVSAAEEKQSVLAKLSHYTDQYINHKLASLLLKKGIEFYREKNQSPIMKRTSEIFHRLTLQSFDGVTVEYNEKDQPVIMGIRNQDEKVEITGMSDGTTDQLYLALRIASIEKYTQENEPMPFIVDDILVHFDDERSKETLKVLLELSKQTQIIFFTHHYRILELMKEISNEQQYQLHEMNTTETAGVL